MDISSYLSLVEAYRLVLPQHFGSSVRLIKTRNSFFPLHALHIVRLQLQLSRNSPLQFFLDCDIRDEVIEEALIAELVSHSSRWFAVYIRAFAPVLRQLSKRLGNLSELKKLILKGFMGQEPDSDMFFDAPNLTSLRLDEAYRVLPSMFLTSNLYQFTGSFYDGPEFRNFVSAAPRLEVLRVHAIGEGPTDSAFQPACPGPRNLTSSSPAQLPHFLRHVYTISHATGSSHLERHAKRRRHKRDEFTLQPIPLLTGSALSLSQLHPIHCSCAFLRDKLPFIASLTSTSKSIIPVLLTG